MNVLWDNYNSWNLNAQITFVANLIKMWFALIRNNSKWLFSNISTNIKRAAVFHFNRRALTKRYLLERRLIDYYEINHIACSNIINFHMEAQKYEYCCSSQKGCSVCYCNLHSFMKATKEGKKLVFQTPPSLYYLYENPVKSSIKFHMINDCKPWLLLKHLYLIE